MILKKNNLTRVVILGSNSFIGKSVIKKFHTHNINPLLISRKLVDFESKKSIYKLKKILKKDDVIIFIAALAPVKDIEMLNKNLLMSKNVVEALKFTKPKHIIYISSDAVYSDSKKKIDEKSNTIPTSLHGFMHLIRETIFNELNCLKSFIRPTLVYGSSDPHNGYGPNKFIRFAQNNKKIILFGKGEEKRDHIHVEDVAEIVLLTTIKKITGIINAVSGDVISFYKIAKTIKKVYPKLIIKTSKRVGPMPHNGYRAFNNSLLKKKFSTLSMIKLSNWIKKKDRYRNI